MRPGLAAAAPLLIRGGRHPLVLAEGVEVVPFDLQLGGEHCALVISGPNTGGKTVLLKAVGLIAALAYAGVVLLDLVARRAVTVVTTHLTQLKDLAARTAGMENASLAFDAETLTPTYRLLQGIPDRSYGLVVAGRLGVPSSVLRQAEALLPAEERSLDALLADAERRGQELEQRASQLAGLEARLAAQREVLSELQEQLTAREREFKHQGIELERAGREQARAFLLEARRRVEDALAMARAAVTEVTAREARRLVEEGVKHQAEALKKLDQVAREKGWTVRGTGKGEGARVRQSPASPEVDLRGLTSEGAESALLTAIDGAVVGDLPYLRIIHGKGTGALRARVQQVLTADARISSFRLGAAPQGGTGVTIVEFAP